ncbi:MAG TPA: glycosyl transferase [Gammaproteobacteria bacterium]|nr:glycosyl transferase [Gammaproteobacteria bacterium]
MNISVVIPTYNRAHTLGRALDSVFAQTRAADEIIVVDDGSTDGSIHLLERYPEVRVLTQPQQGVSAARNTGIHAAHGDWIAFLDSDDEWLPEKLALQTALIEQHPEHRFCHGNEVWIRHGQPLAQKKKHRKQGGWIFENCLPLCVISPSAALIKKDLLLACGCFDTHLPACEDYDLWLKICAREPVLYVEQPLLRKFGGHADQLSRKYWGMDRFRIQALDRLLSTATLRDTQRIAATQMLQHKARLFAKGARKHGRLQAAIDYENLANRYDTVHG